MYTEVKEWMAVGATVQLSNNTGTIKNMLTATLGDSIGYKTDGPVVLSLLIQPTGTSHLFTFNPNDVKPVYAHTKVAAMQPVPQPKERIPFPDHIG